MQIHLLRHTAVAVPQGICYGHADVPLACNFEKRAMQLKEIISCTYDAVYTSPSLRCKLLSSHLYGAQSQDDQRLKEMHFGTWEMQPWAAIPPSEIQPWYDDYLTISPPGGESYQEMLNRIAAFLQQLQHSSLDRVLIITHAGVIRSFIHLCANIPIDEVFGIHIGYGSLTVLRM